MQQQPLRIVVLYSSCHLGSNIILNQVLKMSCFEVVGIVKANIVDFTPNGLSKVHKKYQRTGFRFAIMLFWQRIIQELTFGFSQLLLDNDKLLKTSTSISETTPTHHCKNVNDPECQQFLKDLKPDLFISAYFHQILKTDTLSIPEKGTLNVHPGYLPAFKGSMNYFHAMLHGKQQAGVSVHWMDEGIDTGEILARKSFKIRKDMTQESTMVKTAFIGASLLKRIGNCLVQKKAPESYTDKNDKPHYYKMPHKKHFLVYMNKYRFFRIRDILGLIIWRPLKAQWLSSWK